MERGRVKAIEGACRSSDNTVYELGSKGGSDGARESETNRGSM